MDKAAFLDGRADTTETVDLDRGPVTVRGLSRPQAVEVAALAGDLRAQEELTLLHGVVVDPPLTADEVAAYYAGPGNGPEVHTLVTAIQRLSLTDREGPKSGVPPNRKQRRHGI